VTGFCELGNEISSSVKGGNFGNKLNEYYNLIHGSYLIMLLS
jgi:hypothetical protein